MVIKLARTMVVATVLGYVVAGPLGMVVASWSVVVFFGVRGSRHVVLAGGAVSVAIATASQGTRGGVLFRFANERPLAHLLGLLLAVVVVVVSMMTDEVPAHGEALEPFPDLRESRTTASSFGYRMLAAKALAAGILAAVTSSIVGGAIPPLIAAVVTATIVGGIALLSNRVVARMGASSKWR